MWTCEMCNKIMWNITCGLSGICMYIYKSHIYPGSNCKKRRCVTLTVKIKKNKFKFLFFGKSECKAVWMFGYWGPKKLFLNVFPCRTLTLCYWIHSSDRRDNLALQQQNCSRTDRGQADDETQTNTFLRLKWHAEWVGTKCDAQSPEQKESRSCLSPA